MSMRGYWTQVTDPDNPAAVALNGLPKYLVSSTVTEPDWGDEYRLLTFPVSVGAGKRLFAEDAPPTGFRLLESRTTSMGVIYASLAPSEFTTGVVAVKEGREAV